MSFPKPVAVSGALVATALAAYAFLVEPRWLKVERITITPPRWPAALDGLVIAHLSDLHYGAAWSAGLIRRALAVADAARPDLVALTGDYTVRGHRVSEAAVSLAKLRSRPAFAILGNHDYKAGRRRADEIALGLADLGITVLRNDAFECQVRGARLWVVGLDDYRVGRFDFAAAARGLLGKPGPRLLLIHSPEVLRGLPENAADLALAGHTHAGQVYVPGFTRLFVHRRYSRFVAGTYVHRGVILRVSRGLASVGIPARFLRRPEVTIITVKCPQSEREESRPRIDTHGA